MRRRFLPVTVTVLAAALAAFYFARNPERATLDDAARRDAGGSFVTLSDGITHYELSGPDTGRVVVLVHGRSVPYYIWDSTAVALRGAGFRVLRYDMFGRGYSDRPNVEYSAELIDRQLGELLDSLRFSLPVDLVGLSMGGGVVANFANAHAERLRTLTLVDPVAGKRGPLPFFLRIPGVAGFVWQTTVVPGMADGQASDFVRPEGFPDWADRYRVQMRYRGFGRAMLSTTVMSANVDVDSIYRHTGQLAVPALILWGSEDKTVPFALSDNVRRAIPRAEFHAIAGAGHLPGMEKPAETHAILIQFLRAH